MGGSKDYHTKLNKSEEKEVKKRQISYITYMWNLKYDSNEPIYETETHRHREQTCGFRGGGQWGTEGLGVWKQRQTSMYRIDKRGPTAKHREQYSIFCDKP